MLKKFITYLALLSVLIPTAAKAENWVYLGTQTIAGQSFEANVDLDSVQVNPDNSNLRVWWQRWDYPTETSFIQVVGDCQTGEYAFIRTINQNARGQITSDYVVLEENVIISRLTPGRDSVGSSTFYAVCS